ncbi:MAG: undecaprenyl-phosphate glucose phosphotransferase [Hyphococcus sp.]|nr:MAG: undecaprenyl-phosphate glucose phosphotransferase [Marinicaulis sp.]
MAETHIDKTDTYERARRRPTSASRALFGDIVQFIDFIAVIGTSVLVAYAYHAFVLFLPFDFQYYAAAGIVGATGVTTLMRRDGYYEFDQLLSATWNIRAILSRWVLTVLGLLAFGFALKISENFSRVWLLFWSISAVGFLILSRGVASYILRDMIRKGGVFTRRIAVVGATELAARFAEKAGSAENGITITGIFDPGLASMGDEHTAGVSGDLNALEQAARNGEIDDIVIATPRTSKEDMDRISRRLSSLPVTISICPNIHWLDHTGGAVTRVGDANVLSLYQRPLEDWGGVLKTVEDFVLGTILLVIASPLLLLIACAVKLQSKGPALFVQQRHGFNNAVFKIYKFRTMTVAEDGDEIKQAAVGDARITPLGGFLRRYSLDELPQLINVVKGDMSLVGPRPHALAHNHQYAQLIENYSGRHKVKPGITGWAQVNGFRGETSENELMEQRVRYDLSYIDNWSIWFDFKILLMTILAVIFPKNAV